MLFTRVIRLGAAVLAAAAQASASIQGRGIRPLTDAYTSLGKPNITFHGTTHLIVTTVSNVTFTIFQPSFTGEPDTEALTTVAVSTVTTAVPGPVQKHKGMHRHRAVTTVTEIEGYGTLPAESQSSTSTKETGAIGTTETRSSHDIKSTSKANATPATQKTASVNSPTRPGVMASVSTTNSPTSSASSLLSSSTAPAATFSVPAIPGLTVPPTESEATPVATPTSIHHSGSVRSAHGLHNSLVVVMGASLCSIALAFVVAA